MTDIRLSYCQICKLKGFDIRTGTICSLTNKKPEFYDTCDKYEYDEKERLNLIDKKTKHLDKFTSSEKNAKNVINNRKIKYERTEKLQNDKYTRINIPDSYNIYESRFFYIIYWIIPCIVLIGVLYHEFFNDGEPNESVKMIFYSSAVICLGFVLYALYKILIDREPVLIFNKNGLQIKNNGLIIWRDIILCAIKYDMEQGLSSDSLLIYRLSSHSDINIALKRLSETSRRIGHLIELYKEKYTDYKN